MNVRRKRLLIWVVVPLLALWVAVNVIVGIVHHIHDRQSRAAAQAWLQEAEQDVAPGATKDDAIRWLHNHGACWVGESHHYWLDRKEIQQNQVVGLRRISEGGFWADPMSAMLTLNFDADWRLANAELRILEFDVSCAP